MGNIMSALGDDIEDLMSRRCVRAIPLFIGTFRCKTRTQQRKFMTIRVTNPIDENAFLQNRTYIQDI